MIINDRNNIKEIAKAIKLLLPSDFKINISMKP